MNAYKGMHLVCLVNEIIMIHMQALIIRPLLLGLHIIFFAREIGGGVPLTEKGRTRKHINFLLVQLVTVSANVCVSKLHSSS